MCVCYNFQIFLKFFTFVLNIFDNQFLTHVWTLTIHLPRCNKTQYGHRTLTSWREQVDVTALIKKIPEQFMKLLSVPINQHISGVKTERHRIIKRKKRQKNAFFSCMRIGWGRFGPMWHSEREVSEPDTLSHCKISVILFHTF